MPDNLPDGIQKKHLLAAMIQFDAGVAHQFSDSTVYDVEHEGRRYPPKVIMGLAAEILTGKPLGPYDFKGGRGSKCFRILEKSRLNIVLKPGKQEGLGWIFLGNPQKFDVDDYLSRYSYIYWRAPKLSSEIKQGDHCLIWRSGKERGAIALGRIAETAHRQNRAGHPDCLGNDLWRVEPESSDTLQVGIKIEEVRLDADAGFLSHVVFEAHGLLKDNLIIRNPQGTVFRLQPDEVEAVLTLWTSASEPSSPEFPGALEGTRRLRQHFERERNSTLIENKKKQFAKEHGGRIYCEVCGFDFDACYPEQFKRGFIEAHHLAPLATIDEPRRTTFADLLLVCSNCHRMIHHSKEVDENLNALQTHFSLHPMRELLLASIPSALTAVSF